MSDTTRPDNISYTQSKTNNKRGADNERKLINAALKKIDESEIEIKELQSKQKPLDYDFMVTLSGYKTLFEAL